MSDTALQEKKKLHDITVKFWKKTAISSFWLMMVAFAGLLIVASVVGYRQNKLEKESAVVKAKLEMCLQLKSSK